MAWSAKSTRKHMKIRETPNGKGVTTDIRVTVRDSGFIEVVGLPVGREGNGEGPLPSAGPHDETAVIMAILSCLTELYRAADEHRAGTPDRGK